MKLKPWGGDFTALQDQISSQDATIQELLAGVQGDRERSSGLNAILMALLGGQGEEEQQYPYFYGG